MQLIEDSKEYYEGVRCGTREILRIVDTALQNKIEDKKIRQQLCDEIVFNIGALLDGSGVAVDEKGKEYPMAVCFVDEEGEQLHYNDSEVGFHEMTDSTVDEYFE